MFIWFVQTPCVFSTNEIGAKWNADLLALLARATYHIHYAHTSWSYAKPTLLLISTYFPVPCMDNQPEADRVTPLQQLGLAAGCTFTPRLHQKLSQKVRNQFS